MLLKVVISVTFPVVYEQTIAPEKRPVLRPKRQFQGMRRGFLSKSEQTFARGEVKKSILPGKNIEV